MQSGGQLQNKNTPIDMFHLDCNPKEELNTFSNLDWNVDYAPYEVTYDESEGRYLKATRDIKEGR